MGILRHFQTLFCGVVGTEKNLVGEGYNEAPGFGFSRQQFVRGFLFSESLPSISKRFYPYSIVPLYLHIRNVMLLGVDKCCLVLRQNNLYLIKVSNLLNIKLGNT